MQGARRIPTLLVWRLTLRAILTLRARRRRWTFRQKMLRSLITPAGSRMRSPRRFRRMDYPLSTPLIWEGCEATLEIRSLWIRLAELILAAIRIRRIFRSGTRFRRKRQAVPVFLPDSRQMAAPLTFRLFMAALDLAR